MRVDFAFFTDNGGRQVAVNPLLVQYFMSYDGDKTTYISFGKEDGVTVQAAPRQVEQLLTIDPD